ncbi:MAG: glycosyltransferase family 39 protein [Chloroflexi bacterium]|nr:glycosyltransferase family 39 protein [Chloroflexota bacterium]
MQHFAYVRHLAEGRGLPPQGKEALTSPSRQEGSQPPLYYVLAGIVTTWVDANNFPAIVRLNPHYWPEAYGTEYDNKNVVLHTTQEWPPEHTYLALYLSRWVSLLMGMVAVFTTYLLSREVFHGDRWLVLAPPLLLSCTPQFLFISASVNNDATAAATCGLALWTMAHLIRSGPSWRWIIALGVAVGLACLAKISALGLIPLAILTLLAAKDHFHSSRPLILMGAVLLVLVSLIAGWWYVRNWLLYGNPLGWDTHFAMDWVRTTPAPLSRLWAQLPAVGRSYFAAFGWGNVQFPSRVYSAIATFGLAAFVGLIIYAVKPLPASGSRVICLLTLWVGVMLAALLLWMRWVTAPHGRLLFPAAPAISVLLVLGWRRLVPAKWERILLLPLAAVFVFALAAPVAVIRPTYARPQQVAPSEIPLRYYGDLAALWDFRISPERVVAGENAWVTLCWRALGETTKDYSVFVQIVGHGDEIVADRYTYPGLGSYPTSQWQLGDAFCDTLRVPIPPRAPAPSLYRVAVGLFNHQTQERLPIYLADGTPTDDPFVGQIKVRSPTEKTVTIPNPLVAQFGEEIALLGYRIDQQPSKPGSRVSLALYWQALRMPSADHTVFVHLCDQKGKIVAQADGEPQDGNYPTSWWDAGETVVDERSLTAPLKPGKYSLVVGLYDRTTGTRLSVSGGAFESIEEVVLPVQVTVQ